jgi:hypothetical protein
LLFRLRGDNLLNRPSIAHGPISHLDREPFTVLAGTSFRVSASRVLELVLTVYTCVSLFSVFQGSVRFSESHTAQSRVKSLTVMSDIDVTNVVIPIRVDPLLLQTS